MMPFLDSPWQAVRLNEVCEPKESVDPRRDSTAEFKYVDISCISNKRFEIESWHRMRGADAPSRARKRIRTDDVIVATTRPYLRSIARVPEELEGEICSTGFCVLRPGREVIPDWVFYSVLSPEFIGQLTERMRGANYPQVSDRDVLGSVIPLPPIAEQCRIVRRIDECMERIDEIRTLRSIALAEARSLLTSVLNDLERRYDWSWEPIDDVLTGTRNGRSVSRASSDEANGQVLTLAAVRGVNLDVDSCKAVRLDQNLASRYQVHTHDVFVSRSNTRDLVGLSSIVAGPVPLNTIYPDLLIKLQPDRSKMVPRFLAFILRCPSVRKQVQDRATGTSQSMVKISGRRLREVTIPVPSREEQARVLATLDEALEVSDQILDRLQAPAVEPAREAVLRRAFAGEL